MCHYFSFSLLSFPPEISTSLNELPIALGICLFVGYVQAIAVDEINGFLYWGNGALIERATLKGDNTTVIIDTGKLQLN